MKPSFLFKTILAITVLMAATGRARAELMVGDPAPPLQTGQWIQGEPVTAFDSNHVYVVEFWATWCGPCRESIPHLNRLWQKFKDQGVIVIGVDIWDTDAAVAPFVKKMGTNMTYRVALDDKRGNADGFMSANWWPRKVNHHGIPTAFIINRDGKIAWIGHPMGLKEDVLEQIVSGHYDLAGAAVDYRKERAEEDKFQDLQEKLFKALDKRKWDDAQAALDKITNAFPRFQNDFAGTRLKILLGQKKLDDAYQLAESAGTAHATNAGWQNLLAWTIVASQRPDERCLALAETMAARGVQLTKEKNSAVLDTLARAQFMLGKQAEAIASEEKAVAVEPDAGAKSALEKTLAGYRAGKLADAED